MTRRPTPSRSELPPADTTPTALAAGAQHPELEHVPTLPELERAGLAVVVARNSKLEPTHYRATPAGDALLSAIMRRNGQRLRDDPDLRRRAQTWAVAGDRAG